MSSLEIQELEERLEAARSGAICALTLLLDLKKLKTGRYSSQLCEWAVKVAEQMGVSGDALWDIEVASLLYEVGKIGVPDAVILKPGKLTPQEYEQVRKHPEYGWGILKSISGFERAALLVLHHHERYDGSGYPAGLVGDEIPLGARIIAVVDTLEAMLSDRPYRRGFSPSEVVERLRPLSGTQFDPAVLEQFICIARQDLPGEFGGGGGGFRRSLRVPRTLGSRELTGRLSAICAAL